MRKLKVSRELDLVASTPPTGRGAPFTNAIESEDRGLLESAWKKRTRSVALVMSRNTRGAFVAVPTPRRMVPRMNSFFFSHTGIAMLKLRSPSGASAR